MAVRNILHCRIRADPVNAFSTDNPESMSDKIHCRNSAIRRLVSAVDAATPQELHDLILTVNCIHLLNFFFFRRLA